MHESTFIPILVGFCFILFAENKLKKKQKNEKFRIISISTCIKCIVRVIRDNSCLSVSSLFGLTFLAELGFVKLYGLISIFQIVNYKYKDSGDDLSDDEKITKAFTSVFTKALLYLIFWGISFLMYYILT